MKRNIANPDTSTRQSGTQPHLTAVAPEGTAPGPATGEEIARQVARLRTIEDVRALSDQAGEDYRAGIIDDHVFHSAIEVARRATLDLSAAVVAESCPTWCNAHTFAYGDTAAKDVNLHRHLIEGDGWLIELEESEGGEEGPVQHIDAARVVVPLRQARAYATALLAGCDAIEATR